MCYSSKFAKLLEPYRRIQDQQESITTCKRRELLRDNAFYFLSAYHICGSLSGRRSTCQLKGKYIRDLSFFTDVSIKEKYALCEPVIKGAQLRVVKLYFKSNNTLFFGMP